GAGALADIGRALGLGLLGARSRDRPGARPWRPGGPAADLAGGAAARRRRGRLGSRARRGRGRRRVNLEAVRAGFPWLERCAYLNAGTYGPLRRRTVEAMRAMQQRELELGRFGKGWFEDLAPLRERVRVGLAGLVGVEPARVALTASTTHGCNIVLLGLGLEPGDEVVTTDVEHFGLIGPLGASTCDVRVARVRERPAAEALDAILAEVTPRTRLIALSHVAWSTGQVLPLAELKEQTRLLLLVDGAQSAGAIPVEAAPYDF